MNLQQISENLVFLIFSVLLSSLAMACLNQLKPKDPDESSRLEINVSGHDKSKNCRSGYFRLRGMTQCRPLLDCDDIENDVRLYDDIVLSEGPIRFVRLAKWRKKLVTHNVQNLAGDFQAFDMELEWLKSLVPSHHVVQLIGYCEDERRGSKVFLTEYHRHGSALRLNDLLIRNGSITKSETAQRLRFCVSFAELLDNLHRGQLVLQGQGGELEHAELLLSKMVIADGPWRLVLNHFDYLRVLSTENDTFPESVVTSTTTTTSFNNVVEELGSQIMTTATTDIFVAPQVCNVFLRGQDDKLIKNQLVDIHRKCRDRIPSNRPSASTLLHTYKEVLRKLELSQRNRKKI